MTARRLRLMVLLVMTSLLATGGWTLAASATAKSSKAKSSKAKSSKRTKRPHATHATHAAPALSDTAAARALFEVNLAAIRDRNGNAYLACYLDSTNLPRTGPDGFELGRAGLAADLGRAWPDHIDAADLRLVSLRPGLVYGTYRYRVRYGGQEVAGLSERLFVKTASGWKITATTAFQEPHGTPPPARALVGATLIDGTGAPPVAGAVVLLRGGKIECAGPRAACPVPAGIDVLDVSGLWIVPGVIDAHVHFSQTGWADGRPDALDVRAKHPYDQVEAGLRLHPERFGRSYLCAGVTSVFDVGGYPWTLALPAWAEPDPEVPRIAAAGPLLSTRDHWVNLPGERQFIFLRDEAAAREGVPYLANEGAAAVKVWFIPEKPIPGVRAAGARGRRRGAPATPAAHRPCHRSGRGEGGAAGRRPRAGAQRLGRAGGPGVPRPGETPGHLLLPPPHRHARLPAHVRERRQPAAAGGGRPQRLRRPRDPGAHRRDRRAREHPHGRAARRLRPAHRRARTRRRRQPDHRRARRHPRRHGHRRRQPAHPARRLGLCRDGGHAAGRPDAERGAGRRHPGRRRRDGTRQGPGHDREGQAGRPAGGRRRSTGRRRQPPPPALGGARRRRAFALGAARPGHRARQAVGGLVPLASFRRGVLISRAATEDCGPSPKGGKG